MNFINYITDPACRSREKLNYTSGFTLPQAPLNVNYLYFLIAYPRVFNIELGTYVLKTIRVR